MFRLLSALFFAAILAARPAGASDVGAFTHDLPQLVAVSPSGTHLAMVVMTGPARYALRVTRLGSNEARVMDMGDAPVFDVIFKSDERILVTVVKKDVQVSATRKIKGEGRGEFNRPVIISLPLTLENGVILLPDKSWGTFLAARMPADPEHVTVSVRNVTNGASDLYKVNVLTGKGQLIENGSGTWAGPTRARRYIYTVDWSVATDGFAYLRVDFDEGLRQASVLGRARGGSWKRIANYAVIEGRRPMSFGSMASDSTVFVVDRAGGDMRAVWEYDLQTGRPVRQVLAPPAGEATGPRIDTFTGELVGVSYMASGVQKTRFTNKALAAAQAALDEALPDYPFREIVAYSRDKGLLIVRTEGPSHPPTWHLLDARNMALSTILSSPGLREIRLGAVETVVYPSSDGRQITAYLTLPPGGKRTGLPLVVMPHGGPEAQDDLGFEGWRQFLATRGYAVLQPQFRGSDGFGEAHERAAHGKWGTLVQDDVRAGIAMLAQKGIIDSSRMCIFGWSYGGYMALAGATFSPDLYKCAIAGAGVADLNAMMSWTADWEGGVDGGSYKYWLARMGDRETRTAASPSNFAAAVKIPVMLIHGEEDWIVPIDQSEIMERALKKAGKEVEFHRYKRQRHSFQFGEQSDALTKIEAFLAKHLKP